MAKFTPADEQQRVAEQDRQLQRALQAFAGNIQEKDFSGLEITVMVDGEKRACEYVNHQFIALDTGAILDVDPSNIVGAAWKQPEVTEVTEVAEEEEEDTDYGSV